MPADIGMTSSAKTAIADSQDQAERTALERVMAVTEARNVGENQPCCDVYTTCIRSHYASLSNGVKQAIVAIPSQICSRRLSRFQVSPYLSLYMQSLSVPMSSVLPCGTVVVLVLSCPFHGGIPGRFGP